MSYSTLSITQPKPPPDRQLSCSVRFWIVALRELRRRCASVRESGAFLLGQRIGNERRIQLAVYYDDLDPKSLDTGIVRFGSSGYTRLWRICEQRSMEVLADVHCHPGSAGQSESDRSHPMIPMKGHTAMIVPNFADRMWHLSKIGIYQYRGSGCWTSRTPPRFKNLWSLRLGDDHE